jgi:hypothetical protein
MRSNILTSGLLSVALAIAPMVETAVALDQGCDAPEAAVCASTDRLPPDGQHAPGGPVMRPRLDVAGITTSGPTNARVLGGTGRPISASLLALLT